MSSARGWLGTQTRDAERPLLFSYVGLTRVVPLIVCGGFFLLTLLLLVVGPINWNLDHPVRTYGFLVAAAVALVGGYLATVRRARSDVDAAQIDADDEGSTDRPRGLGAVSVSTWVIVGSIVYLVLYLPTVHTTTGKWYPDVWLGFTDASTAYDTNKWLGENTSQAVLYLRFLVAPITLLILPLTLYFYPRLSRLARVLGVVCIVLSLALTIAQGINRGVAETCANIILFLVLVAASAASRRQYRRVLGAILAMFVVGGLFFSYYSATLGDRVAADAVKDGRSSQHDKDDDEGDELRRVSTAFGGASERGASPFFQVVPSRLQPTGIAFDSYVTQGYRGLDLAMGHDWRPTFGLGFSDFVRHNALRAVGKSSEEDAIEARTYAGQIDGDGWPIGQLWGTFFIHPASDIGFPATIVLTALIGAAFGLSWRDLLQRRNPFAGAVFYYLCILVIYLPANNQLYQGGELTVGFTALLVAWLWSRRRFLPARVV